MAPWLTVVTVVRNAPAELAATLRSVADQHAPGVEHLVVDGASTDETRDLALAAAVRDPWVQAVSEPDSGIYDAMNKGWRRATGGVIHFLNAGDVYRTTGELGAVQERLRESPTPWLRTRVRFVDAHGRPTRPVERVAVSPCWFWWGWQAVAHQGAFMSRDLLADLHGFDTRYRIVADHDLMRRALAAGIEPSVWDRVTVDVGAGGASTQHYSLGYREMHRSRSDGRTWPVRFASRLDAGMHTSVVATKRGLRWAAERTLGTQRVREVRAGER